MLTQTILSAALLVLPAIASPAAWGSYGGSKGGSKGGWGGHNGGWSDDKGVIPFTSTYSVTATPGQVVNGTTPTGGLKGAIGYYDLGLNSDLNLICYYIRIYGFRGDYLSPAITATHIHEAAKGASGPPRLAFPNPVPTGKGDERVSVGCLQGPFTTGVKDNVTGVDTGANFKVSQIQANPAGFFADVHSSLAPAGAVRGQLA